ncbi:MAG: DUF6702 family protein [Nannocystales bacterium]
MNRRSWIAGAIGLLALPQLAHAHPVHASAAVADIRGRRLEVTLTVAPEDLQEALRRESGRALDIDTDANIDALAQAYVEERFILADGSGPLPLNWIGCEVTDEAAHLFFEFKLPKAPREVTLRNAVFFELTPAQVNRVQVRRGKSSVTHRFRATDPARRLFGR